jgi:hypothetical protein
MCWFRGLYGNYSTRWHVYLVDLTPEQLVLRRPVPFRRDVRTPITEGLVSAWLRRPESLQEGRRIGASGQYAPGGSLEVVGHQIISCKTTEGILEFAVRQVDVPLLLQYITMKAQIPNPVSPVPQDVNVGTSLHPKLAAGLPYEQQQHSEHDHY